MKAGIVDDQMVQTGQQFINTKPEILAILWAHPEQKQTGKSGGIPHDEIRLHFLKDPKQAGFALKLALKEFEGDGNVNALLDTLRLVAQAQGGLAKLARETTISRKALHEALSPKGNPRLRTFQSVLGSLGLQMSVKPLRRTTQKVSSAA